MASAAEQLASNLNFSAFARADELKKRIWFTLGALLIYRLGTYIPVPGIDGVALRQFMEDASAGLGGMLQMFTGGALGRKLLSASGLDLIAASDLTDAAKRVVAAARGR